MKKIRKNKWKLLLLVFLSLFLLWINYVYVSYSSNELIFDNSNDIPKSEYALFLGTPKYLSDGSVNNYYKNRITSVVELYTKKKIKKIIISADTLNKYKENEVELIKSDLIQKGINESNLMLDKNGNRTWKSIINLNDNIIIGKIILISQRFHLERAIYITKEKNIDAIGFEAKGKMSKKLWVREILARVKMQIDFIIN
ncbi:vancomycin high temperature exclusion protein [Aquimarina sp. I32.4]|uniref:SanA/YdcF family protein n=1 Tax=Aquimarina sp. I32.4 TaxID=2053903 RepID=UPI001304C5A3|nr:ElyC/SanA/YdcF family protein [Aquimarina sp. I32.4]